MQAGYAQGVEKIYYGTKACSSMYNPCKGACTRICARIYTRKEKQDPEVMYDADSQTTTYWFVPADTPDDVYNKMKQKEKVYPNLKVIRGNDAPDSKENEEAVIEKR